MTSPGGHEPPDHDQDDTAPDTNRRWRDEIERAEPPPVTEAMITPRPAEFLGSPDGPMCHVCGSVNHDGASYCLNCGVQLHSRPATSLREEIAAARQSRPPEAHPPDPDDGLEFIDPDALAAEVGRRRPAQEPVPDDVEERDSRRTLRTAFAAMMVVAALALFVVTFGGNGNPPPETTTTTTEGADVAERYGTLLTDLANRVDQLAEQAAIANSAWDSGSVDFDTTLAELQRIAGATTPLEQTVRNADLPATADPALHARLTTTVATLAAAGTGMVNGLQAADTGELRRAELARYEAAAAEFSTVVASIHQALGSGA